MPVQFPYDSDYWHSRRPYYRHSEAGWCQTRPPSPDTLRHTVLLLGDTGHPELHQPDPVLQLVAGQLAGFGSKMTVVFLGDNIYPRGLPAAGHRLRAISEARLRTQLDLFAGFAGRLVYLSGNHDWNKGRPDGYEYLRRQEEYIRQYTGREDVLLPAGGCPGPAVLPLAEGFALVAVNTQWWVQRGFRPIGRAHGCAAESESHFFELLKQTLAAQQGERILMVGHHPLYSNALHGGRFTWKHHLFPLTAMHKKLFVPLPVAGSLYPLYRRLFGANEDMAHPFYARMKRKLLAVLRTHENIVYAAGHDHNLQYFHRGGNHYLVSGSGSKISYVHKGGKAGFTHAHQGVFRMDQYQNGEWWLRVLEPGPAPGETSEVFRKKI